MKMPPCDSVQCCCLTVSKMPSYPQVAAEVATSQEASGGQLGPESQPHLSIPPCNWLQLLFPSADLSQINLYKPIGT